MNYLISVLNFYTKYSCVYEYICIFVTLYRDTYSYSLPSVSCMEQSICLALNVLFASIHMHQQQRLR